MDINFALYSVIGFLILLRDEGMRDKFKVFLLYEA